MIDKRIIIHYWQLAVKNKSIVVFEEDRLKHEFYLNENDFGQFPELRGAVCLTLWEDNGKVKYELDVG